MRFKQNQTLMEMVASQTEMRTEQAAQNTKNDNRFERMLIACMRHSTRDTPTESTNSGNIPTRIKRRG